MSYPNPTQPVIINVSKSFTPQADTLLRTFCVVSCGDTSWNAGESKVVNATDFESNVTASTHTLKVLKSFFSQAPRQSCIVIEVKGQSSPAVSAQVKTLQDYIKAGLKIGYGYYIPPTITADTSCEGLFSAFNGLNDKVCFFIDMEKKAPSTSTLWTTYVNKSSSVFGAYPNISTIDFIPAGVVMGVCAGSAYNINASNKLSDLDGKILSGIQSQELDTATAQSIADASASFFFNDGTTCLLGGGRMADGEFWTTKYAWNLTMQKVEASLKKCLYDSSNIPNTAIYFDEQGINTLKQKIINTLQSCKKLGLLEAFGSGKDLATDTLIGLDDIYSISAQQWKTDNPDDYAKGIYGGFTAYLQVQGFIQQVVFNVNKG